MTRAMLKHMLKHHAQAMQRGTGTYVTYVRTNEESWLSRREILTFRNARTHIRIFPSASQGQRYDAEEAQ